ncbi:MAG TPA: chemotaxis protein CheA [Polyangia bacterium]|jgi:two-component system chemotaxis sensor kinase CheA|nr:chemotaxis protein CheA [Polyangia bacterium]
MSDDEQDEIITEFLVEAHENLDALDRELLALEKNPNAPGLLASVFRRVHTVKGACGFLGFSKLEIVAHASENLLSKVREEELELTPTIITALLGVADTMRGILRGIEANGKEGDEDHSAVVDNINLLQRGEEPPPPPAAPEGTRAASPAAAAPPPATAAAPAPAPGPAAPAATKAATAAPGAHAPHPEPASADLRAHNVSDSYLRVDVALLDKLMNLVGELVLARNQVLQVAPLVDDQNFSATSQRLNLITTELQSGVMKTRMQPIGNIWEKLPRVVRDLALICGKQVRVEMEGTETELDKTIIEAIKDPLTHLVRNCVDHGIETAVDRVAGGKTPDGRLSLRAYHEGGQVNIEISDDGKGMDLEAIKNKGLERNLITPEQVARMTDRDLQNLIFLPGLSTAEKISNVSGRGVGMDVVKTNIEKIGGVVDVHSRRGLGTTFRIKIPLTLAIIPALIVTTGGERYAVPQISLLELVRLTATQAHERIELVQGAPVYRLRGNLLPLVYLNRELEIEDRQADAGEANVNIVVLQTDNRRFGLVVDQVNDTEEIVVKPLGQHLKGITAFAGATIMGDGRVALILDILGIAQHARVISEAHDRASAQQEGAREDKGGSKQTLLLFLTRDGRRMAIPLSIVARLEEFPRQSVERFGVHAVVQYRDRILPLVDIVDLVDGGSGGGLAGQDPLELNDTIHVVVYNEGQRSVGVVVGQIVDIVDDAIDLSPGAGRGGLSGCAVIQQKVTELINLEALVLSRGAELLDLYQSSQGAGAGPGPGAALGA